MHSDNFPRLFLMELYEYQSKISQNPMLIPCLIQVKRQFDLARCQPAPSLALCSLISIIDNFISQKSLKYNHIVIQPGLCVLVSEFFSLGKISLGLISYWDWQAPQLLPLSTNTSQHQAVNRYWHMKCFALIDLYLHLACFKFNLQGSLILVAIKYATYPAISTWQHLMVQISFQYNPQLPSLLARAFCAII